MATNPSWPQVPDAWLALLPAWTRFDGTEIVPRELEHAVMRAEGCNSLCPPLASVWRAFELTAPSEVRVVLLGQDPYHGAGQAHGLAFSVADPSLPAPPSLRNMFKERASDLQLEEIRATDLSDWAEQGVLMLNTSLTTELGTAGAHQHLGWEMMVQTALLNLMQSQQSLVWILWGRPAQTLHATLLKEHGQSRPMDTLIASPHPSPLAAYRGFWGSKPFSRANEALQSRGERPIRW
ncbi:MAG: uracil-DNA glycosylase [Flavobacteriales bacterium]